MNSFVQLSLRFFSRNILFFSNFNLKNLFFLFLTTELIASWESLLHWSENESVAKQLHGEMAALVEKLNKVGTSSLSLDTESAIQLAIEETEVSSNLIDLSKENLFFVCV